MKSHALVVATIFCAGAAFGQTTNLEPVSEGATRKIGGYRPQKITLSEQKPATITKLPEGLSAPLYGVLPIGPQGSGRTFHVVLDEPAEGDARLFVDTNGNGDLTDDAAAKWGGRDYKAPTGGEFKQYSGSGAVELAWGDRTLDAHLGMYRFDKNDPARAANKDALLYYADYAYEGEVAIGGQKYRALLADDMTRGDFRGDGEGESSGVRLFIDRNANGKFDVRGESFDIRKPFNIGGTTYEIADMDPSGAAFKVVKSSRTVAEIPLPPDHSVGKKITAFEAATTDGKQVSFPSSYKGKIVLLDFWATWCGPCMAEVPELVSTYEEFRGQGFDILGISLDRDNALDKLKDVTSSNRMNWPHVYDGKFWQAEIAELYVIRSIPAAFLVDGDTGEILATGGMLRGQQLKKTIQKAIEDKREKSRS